MEFYYSKIIETAVVLIAYVLFRRLFFRLINKTLKDRLIAESRGAVIKRVIHLIVVIICLLFIFVIWGVKQADLAIFIGSILTVVGVAFFAQWSLLSNITSGLILFFNHPVRIYDNILILEGKDYIIEGRVVNIGLFFITIETKDDAEMTFPNNVFIQKSIKKIKS